MTERILESIYQKTIKNETDNHLSWMIRRSALCTVTFQGFFQLYDFPSTHVVCLVSE